jgi:hypothetical protein
MRPAVRFIAKATRYGIGDRPHKGANPPYGALVTYHLKEKPGKDVKLTLEVLDEKGTVVRTIKKTPAEAGWNRTSWDLAYDRPRPRKEPEKPEEEDEDSEFGPPNRGPQALPGTYRVRLRVGETVAEQPIVVRVDPTVQVTRADLEAQHAAAVKLRDLRTELNDVLRGLDALKLQLDERKKLAATLRPEAPADWKKGLDTRLESLDTFIATLTRPSGKPFWSEGPRLAEHLQSLAGSLDNGNRRPTGPEEEFAAELTTEMERARKEIARFTGETVAEINTFLQGQGLPPLLFLHQAPPP